MTPIIGKRPGDTQEITVETIHDTAIVSGLSEVSAAKLIEAIMLAEAEQQESE